jgi:hypothetical protein
MENLSNKLEASIAYTQTNSDFNKIGDSKTSFIRNREPSGLPLSMTSNVGFI